MFYWYVFRENDAWSEIWTHRLISVIFARAIQELEQILEEADLSETTPMSIGGLVALLYKSKGPFKGLKIQANDHSVRLHFKWIKDQLTNVTDI